MLQLDVHSSQKLDKHHAGGLDREEINEMLKETFAK